MSTQAIFTVDAPDLDLLPLRDAEAALRAFVEPLGAIVTLRREEAVEGITDDEFIALVRAELITSEDLEPDQVSQVREVVFSTTEYDNGYFFDGSAIVLFNDGSRQDWVDLTGLDSFLSDLSAEYAPLGSQAQLTVNLQTNTVDADTIGLV